MIHDSRLECEVGLPGNEVGGRGAGQWDRVRPLGAERAVKEDERRPAMGG